MSAHTEPSPVEAEADTGRLDGASPLRVWSIVIIIALFGTIASLQYTMIAAALPKIAPSFASAGANISWAITIFGVVGAVSTPILGKMSDIWGKRNILAVCGLLFIAGSVLCALTHDFGLLLLGRGLEACATAAGAVSYGLIRDLVPRRSIPMAVGVIGGSVGGSALAAPMLGGWMVDHYSWRLIFWSLAVFAAVVLTVLWLAVPESRLRVKQRLDLLGAVVLGGGVACVLLYVSEGGSWGWTAGKSIVYLAVGLVLLAGFVPLERQVEQPLIDIKILASPKVAMTMAVSFCAVIIFAVTAYALPYMAQTPTKAQLTGLAQAAIVKAGLPTAALPLLHISFPGGTLAFAGGLTLLGFAWRANIYVGLAPMATGPLGGGWAHRAGGRKPLIAAMAFLLAGALLLLVLPLQGVWGLAVVAAVVGIGNGFYFAAAPTLIMEAVPAEQQGVTTGMWSVASAMGSAVASAVLTAFFVANPLKISVAVPGRPATVQTLDQLYSWAGYRDGFIFAAAVGVVGLVIAVLMKHGRTPSTGGAPAELETAPLAGDVVGA